MADVGPHTTPPGSLIPALQSCLCCGTDLLQKNSAPDALCAHEPAESGVASRVGNERAKGAEDA